MLVVMIPNFCNPTTFPVLGYKQEDKFYLVAVRSTHMLAVVVCRPKVIK